MPKFSYTALRYAQRDGSELFTFSAPVGEIKVWAGVPRKHFNYQHGFQRALLERRVEELRQFYDEDEKNVTPTAVVVAVRQGAMTVTELPTDSEPDGLVSEGICKLAFDLEDYENETTANLINTAVSLMKNRLGAEVSTQIEQNLQSALEATAEAEASDEALQDEAEGEVADFDAPPPSHLAHFYSELLALQSGLQVIADEPKLRQVLFSLLKPAIIVDGQHRVYGAAAHDEGMRFAVSAIPDVDWLEQVFQFVVINQKAKPIDPAFLHAIIATSLTDEEIAKLYERLRKSGVDVEKAQYMNRINTDEASPFRDMIDFEIEGAPGFLKFPGMSSLARSFKQIPKMYSGMVASPTAWVTGDAWLIQFYAFWSGIRDYFESEDFRLWREPSEANPNNLLKIVTLQEIQRIVLDAWADARVLQLDDVEKTRQTAKSFWAGFPATFFTDEWKKKGLQTAVGRKYLSEAIQTTRRNLDRKHWGHRKLGLFQDA